MVYLLMLLLYMALTGHGQGRRQLFVNGVSRRGPFFSGGHPSSICTTHIAAFSLSYRFFSTWHYDLQYGKATI